MGARTVLEKQVRRQQILDAAIKVFAEKGYKTAAIADIIDEVGVARGTFYLYFKSKADVFRAILDFYLDGVKDLVVRETKRSYSILTIREKIRESLMDSLNYYVRNRSLAKIVFREAMAIDPQFQDKCLESIRAMQHHWKEAILRMQKFGVVRKEIDADHVTVFMTGMFIQVVLEHIIPKAKPDLETIADQYMDFMLKGLASDMVR